MKIKLPLLAKSLTKTFLIGIGMQCAILGPLAAQQQLFEGKGTVGASESTLGNVLRASAVKAEIQVTGVVKDETEFPIPGVTVIEYGTTNGTVTDLDGKYTLTVQEGASLVYSFVGYKAQTIPVEGRSFIDVFLQDDVGDLDEVVVVAYGTQKKSNLTGSVTDLKADRLVQTPATNVKGLLIGQVPGLISNQNPGLPGEDNATLSIRGFGNPLVIVDGIESFLDRIDPNDIETVTVLKDASAAIYGARAGNGVILVTTKRGKAGSMSVNYHGYVATQKRLTFAKQVDAAGFIQLGRDAVFNGQYDPLKPDQPISYGTLFTEEKLNQYESGELPSYDWVDAVLKDTGSPLMSHNLSFRGGSEKIRYYSSVGYTSQSGIFKGDYDYKKLTLTNNMDIDLSKNIVLILNGQYIKEDKDYSIIDPSTIWNDLQTSQPLFNPDLPDPDRAPYSGFSGRSPVARINQKFAGYSKSYQHTLTGSAELKYSLPFVKGLSVGGKVNVRARNLQEAALATPYDVWSYDPNAVTEDFDGYTLEASLLGNSFSRSYGSFSDPINRILSRGYATYEKAVDKHEFGFLFFGEKEDNTYRQLTVTRTDLLSTEVPQIGGTNELTRSSGTGRDIQYTRVSFAGRFNYAYDEKYLLEATLRADASSKFGNNAWGYFPSVSVGWNIAREDFLATSDVLDQFKLRLSYSQTGVDSNVGNTSFNFLSGFEESSGAVYYLDGSPTAIISNTGLVNPDITWESTTLYNAGIDLTMFNGKLYSTLDVFYRYRDGLLRTPLESLPSTFGAALPQVNLDSRSNRGFELSLGNQGTFGEFKYEITAGVAYARERYENYEEDINFEDPIQVEFDQLSGRWVNITYGYKTDGLFNTQAEVDQYLEQYTIEDINGRPKPGDIRYVDINEDGVINRADRYQIGYGTNPDITYSLAPRLSYRGFSLAMLWQGGTRFNVNISGLYRGAFNNEQVPLELHEQYTWTQDPNNPGIGSNPNAQLPAYERNGTRTWNNINSDFWMYNGTYLRLKTATVSYSLPSSFLSKIGLSNANVYMSGDNLLSFNNMGIFKDAVDPEEATSANAFKLPLLRTMSFGVQLGF
ncbi:SusC/RagA family TonB-linked outer membrane protein [Algoriphagus winogradskyi]|uniref:TonB-linked outer membrane protein, SusC/RagA family n=1 Tax=Algoriphagus winogradskyi TaxID=237017 RepID=A0ABY1NYH7_9BACT|nr:TonB-dependent receptor [Algoriphagus winogradskyi]SMP22085.1 TonB-linked outer membrane protein, SusC/RagA family [Algoriphagus winogradskyi]